jgi:protein SCO1/2
MKIELSRRGLMGAAALTALPGRARADDGWANIDVSSASPALAFSMVRASDGNVVSAADYGGDVALLYFGYTFCPDVCPLTLSNLGHVLDRMGPAAAKVRVLFVTVDPDRDTLPVLKAYMEAFGPGYVGLRGDGDALVALARRYRIAFSVTKPVGGRPYEVTHSSAIYAFDGTGAARLLIPSMASSNPDIAGTAADLTRLASGAGQPGLLSHLLGVLERLG